MLKKVAALSGVLAVCAVSTVNAADEKEVWHGPFGGTFTAGGALVTDYSYRGLSQTQRSVAFQPTMTYETPTVSEKVPLSASGAATSTFRAPAPLPRST